MINAINVLSIILISLCWFFIIKKLFWSKVAPVKTVKAELVDKYKTNIVSTYQGAFKRECYMIVFETKEKKLSFRVTSFSYDNYRIGEKGTLKYKGHQIISFK